MTPLERAAKALYERDHDGRFKIIGEPCAWEELTPESKATYIDEARAVLTSIREPSEGMYDAGESADWVGEDESHSAVRPSEDGPGIWQAMIDAALAEGE
jgi:hypothetical protein